MKRRIVLGVLVVLSAAAFASVGGASSTATPRSISVGVPLTSISASGARGLAYFQQRGLTLRYWVVVFGLEPDSSHAAHIHGPSGACTPASANKGVAVPFPDLKADENGVAYRAGSINLRQAPNKQVLRKGFYFNVHAFPTAQLQSKGLAAITCGNIRLAS
jgi:CHRD domain